MTPFDLSRARAVRAAAVPVVEQIVQAHRKPADTALLAGKSAVRGATPLNFNHFKNPLLQNLVTRAIRDA